MISTCVFSGGGVFLLHLGPYFVGDEVTDNVEKELQKLESSEYLEKFRKCISVTLCL